MRNMPRRSPAGEHSCLGVFRKAFAISGGECPRMSNRLGRDAPAGVPPGIAAAAGLPRPTPSSAAVSSKVVWATAGRRMAWAARSSFTSRA
jgi:hypothetical protein